jgi:hypothetical protein
MKHLTLSFLVFLQNVLIYALEIDSGSLPIRFKILFTRCSMARQSDSALA